MVEIRAMIAADWPAVEAIYAEGIATRQATFETDTPTWEEFDCGRLSEHRSSRSRTPESSAGPRSRRRRRERATQVSPSIRSTSTESARGRGIGKHAHGSPFSRAPTPAASGLSRRASSRRTRRASRSTRGSVFASLVAASASPSSTASGATPSCSSGASERDLLGRLRASDGTRRTRCARRTRTSC